MNYQDEINDIIAKMTIEEKVGQCLVIGFVGTVITPAILKRIRTIKPAGLRVGLTFRSKSADSDPYAYNELFLDRVLRKPHGTIKDFKSGVLVPNCTNEEYCQFLNQLKTTALENDNGLPIHITFDMEGDASADYFRGGIKYIPSQMGIGLTGIASLAYDSAWAVAQQLVPIGFNWIHSPVLDVNTNPNNPEIGSRSYGEKPDEVLPFALEALKAYKDQNLIATGKHFPGRGASSQDAHGELPVINLSKDDLMDHIKPFKALIDAGIPSIMTAHTAYPAFDPSGKPATLSKIILTDLLKGELGFEGVITTDDITMGGIVEKYEVYEACIMAINAGADLVLFRDESALIDEVFPKLVEAAVEGVISEERLNDAISRTLKIKFEYGLFEKGGLKTTEDASTGINNPKVAEVIENLAKNTVGVLRDEAHLLPLKSTDQVLLVEQIHPLHYLTNDQNCHPGLLWEKMLHYSKQVGMVETSMDFDDDSKKRVLRRVDEADVIVVTNYYLRRYKDGNQFVKMLIGMGKPVVVITNSPYEFTLLPEYKTVLMNFGASPESYHQVAKCLFEERG